MAGNKTLFNLSRRKRFLAPLIAGKNIAIRYCYIYSVSAFFGVFTIIMIGQISSKIETLDRDGFILNLIIFAIGAILIHLNGFIFRNKGWPYAKTLDIYTYEPIIRDILESDNTKFERLGTGKIMAIINSGLETWNKALIDFMRNVCTLTITGCFSIYLMNKISWYFVLIFIIIFILVGIIVNYANQKSNEQRNISRDIQNEWTRKFVKIMMSKFDILQNNKVDYEINALKKNTYERFESEKKRSLVTELVFKTPEFGGFILRFLIFLIIGIGVFGGKYSYAELIMFSGALSLIDGVISSFVLFYFNFISQFNGIDKLRETMDYLSEGHTNSINLGNFTFKHGNISIKNVNFSYGQIKIFENFSLNIQSGTISAFVGESGGGKTTLLKLIAGYMAPDGGVIKVDNQDINQINKADYYKHIGYLSQDPSVFDGTIYENLIYALKDEPEEEILNEVIKLSKCEFIRDFKDGLKTEIGERGILLSGGQKQRLAIAKIMLKNPNIILLDEPTSALDSENEEKISQAFKNLFKGRTVIIVAHRLQTVKNADKIFFLEKGKIIEEGTHKELIKLNGKYKKMLDLQSGF